jgi:virginiamycin B lyase
MRPILLALAISLAGSVAIAGGSNYGVKPGTRAVTGKISEWPVPTPSFARDPAIGADGNIYITVMNGNKIARFDIKTQTFKEWELPRGARPHGLLVAPDGKVFYTGNGNGTIGELDPATGQVAVHKTLSGGGGPHTIVMADDATLWFTMQSGDRIGRLERNTGRITEYPTRNGPYGLTLDKAGNVWFCQFGGTSLGRLDPKTGKITELDMGAHSHPRRIATAPDGMLWVTQYGKGTLAKVDPVAGKIVKEYPLPAGASGGPYAVTVDGAGHIWANEIQTDTVVMLDPASEAIRVFDLPSHNVGIRKMIVDGQGRLWYMGSHNGRLGMIE